MTADWFFPGNHTIIICLLKGTFDDSPFIAPAIYTNFIFTRQRRRYPAKFITMYIFPLFLYFINCLFGKIRFDLLITIQHCLQFAIVQRGTGITVFATTAFAFCEITSEFFFHHVITDQYIVNYYHGSFFQSYVLLFSSFFLVVKTFAIRVLPDEVSRL